MEYEPNDYAEATGFDDRIYDEIKDACCLCESKEEAQDIVRLYGLWTAKYLTGWLNA